MYVKVCEQLKTTIISPSVAYGSSLPHIDILNVWLTTLRKVRTIDVYVQLILYILYIFSFEIRIYMFYPQCMRRMLNINF